MKNISFILMDIIVIIPFTCELIRILFGIREFKKAFTCDNCDTFNKTIYKETKCSKCHRKFKIHEIHFDYLLINKHSYIDTKNVNTEYIYKDYIKPFRIELVICLFAEVIMISALVINILDII